MINKDLIEVALNCIAIRVEEVRQNCKEYKQRGFTTLFSNGQKYLTKLLDAQKHLETLYKEN